MEWRAGEEEWTGGKEKGWLGFAPLCKNYCGRPLIIYIFSNIVFTSLVTDERTDGRTDGQVENIKPPPASLA